MKKLFDTNWGVYLIIASFLFLLASCDGKGGTVDGYTVSNQGKFIVVQDSIGKNIGTKEVFADTLVDVIPYFGQKVKIAAHHGGLAVFIAAIILGVVLLVVGFIQTFVAQKHDATLIIWPVLAIICGIIAFGSVEWARGKEVPMPKTTYDSIIVNHGDLKGYLDTQILK